MTPDSTRTWRAVGLGLLLALTAGCAKSTSLAEVGGTVTFEGKPLSGVVVTFYPIVEKGEPRGATSRGTTDEAGKYTLTCEDAKPGAVVGKHRVVISWPVRSGHEIAKNPDPMPIPTPYTVASDTPLQRDVTAGQNTIDLDVKR